MRRIFFRRLPSAWVFPSYSRSVHYRQRTDFDQNDGCDWGSLTQSTRASPIYQTLGFQVYRGQLRALSNGVLRCSVNRYDTLKEGKGAMQVRAGGNSGGANMFLKDFKYTCLDMPEHGYRSRYRHEYCRGGSYRCASKDEAASS